MSNQNISLLPDHVANQIAAGEVVQRPASVVKELLENAIDAGATQIKLIVKDAGKSLIQVIDNGKGMGPIDARMCFERHATSKITKADDLFSLTTKGFRGEALASIAAIAQVELKTRQESDLTAQQIIIEGGKFLGQHECQFSVGSSFTVKNLFFNIPARRNFLKNDQVELKHIIDELERVAIPHANIHFIFISNEHEILNLTPGNLMARIKSLLGNYIQKELIHIGEDTPFVKIDGYVTLPESAIKSKKEQYFFVNNRFVRNPFLNHAVYQAYKELMSSESHPRYFIFLELDPKHIDINIHPTKTEIKFTDEKTVYMLLLSAIKRALGKANVGPSLDFEQEVSFNAEPPKLNHQYRAPEINVNPNYNPFKSNSGAGANTLEKLNKQNWESMFEGFKQNEANQSDEKENTQHALESIKTESASFDVFQINHKYIITSYNNNLLAIDLQRAHERILYEHYLNTGVSQAIHSQQLLFPEHIELSTNDFTLLKDLLDEFKLLGFDINIFGKNNIAVNGSPSDLEQFNVKQMIEGILETYKLNTLDHKIEKHDNLCQAMAKNACIKYGKVLEIDEMKMLVSNLLHCENYLYTASGKTIMMEMLYQDIEKHFKK